MKNYISRVRFRNVLPFLFLAVLFTLPSTSTGSKYVWEDTINVELKVLYPESEITSLLPDGYPSEFWVQELQNIQATATEEGLVLSAEEGYTLPECITVEIGQTVFSVKTDGTEAPDGIIFNPETGMLRIADSLLSDRGRTVVVIGSGIVNIQ